ncbi:uncharacterized protein LOC120450016 [Drosophila santomea]|uniref:uncharacterized protein LOC120450016 n=1 Tax=Drosophila santomea TaxID=129105 RepID=UPI0019538556|nr:uncharacterized protein LOC120450016 [Drosophila santomea]
MSKSKSDMFGSSHNNCTKKVYEVAGVSLRGKPSYVVCRGKTSRGLTEVDSSTDLREPYNVAIQQEVQNIMKHQQNIIKMVDGMYRDIANQKGFKKRNDYDN